MKAYIFVGERQSPRAAAIGATWQNRGMCARTLCAALETVGVLPEEQEFVNLWQEPGLRKPEQAPDAALLAYLSKQAAAIVIIGMGKLVQAELDKAGIPYRSMVHPAARGAIRRTDTYVAHVRSVLLPAT